MRDPLTGLNSLGARYYDAGLARFISVDPASNQASAQAANGYAYGNNNPVVFTDPTGLWGWSSITHAVSSAASWVVEHKQQIASVAVGIAVGVAVCATGIGCAAELTFAAAGALAASGAAGNVASYGFDVATGAVKNPSVGGVLKAAGFGAAGSVLTLGAGKFVGAALRRPAGKRARPAAHTTVSRLGPWSSWPAGRSPRSRRSVSATRSRRPIRRPGGTSPAR